ncbi:MAG TPA: hypothetical protein ENI69_04705 [Rhodospirillales bacterium]|nr:hypothetical protein [Rhodospirillales bacterium]
MTTVCIHQPDFAPWLGFFDRLLEADIFVVLDNVQFVRRGWHHRDKIKTPGGAQWLTVPVIKKGRYHQAINEVEIDNSRDWRAKHLRTIQTFYGKACCFDEAYPAIENIYAEKYNRLIDLNMRLLAWFMEQMKIEVDIRFASELGVKGTKNDLLIGIVQSVSGDVYLTGQGASSYLDEAEFIDSGISVLWQSYQHPVYPQLHDAFIPQLSSLDCLLNCGSSAATAILRRNGADGI